jgi:Uma2 family endonuclease
VSHATEARSASKSERPTGPSAPESRKVFNRSSLQGDFLVTIPDQTAEDFEEHAPESQFCEFVEGTIYMPSPVSDRHQDLVLFLTYLFGDFLDEHPGLGHILAGPAVLRLTPERFLEPDIFIRPLETGPDRPPASFVLEVLSPSNRAYDLEWKSAFYQAAKVPEIWYLDDRDRRVIVVDRRNGDTYDRERVSTGVLASSALPGFWIDVSWLWSDPLPKRRECSNRILAGPPA